MTRSRKLLGFLSLSRISGQIAALVLASLVVIHLIIAAFFVLSRSGEQPRFDHPEHNVETVVLLLAATPAAERPGLVEHVNRAIPQLDVKLEASDAGFDFDHGAPVGAPSGPTHIRPDQPSRADESGLRPPGPEASGRLPPPLPSSHPGPRFHLGPGYDVAMTHGPDDTERIAIRLPDRAVLSAKMGPDRSPPLIGGPWTPTVLFVVVSVSLLGLWAARALSAPLSAFAQAAEDFSLGTAVAPLPETGPYEIRSAAKALNRMRERISTLMKDRTQMLAAISHDLRTPITRLRMRMEFIEDETHRDHMVRDLEQMRTMLESVLSFLRDDDTVEPMTLVDLTAMLHLICDQFSDLGHKVSYSGPDRVTITARPDDLLRAVTNLVENAVRFATEVVIAVSVSGQQVVIDVEDDGPGIDDARKAAMLEPFVRGDIARNMDEASGFGLGLSIAQTIVAAHGGTLSLHNHLPHGLTARIALPRRAQRKSAA